MAPRKSARKKTSPPVSWVAVVQVPADGLGNANPDGKLSSFVGLVKEDVISDALEAAASWGARNGRKYEVWIGTLTERVVVPTSYRLVKLDPLKGDPR